MENKENIINELYRNMQLMQIDSSHLNEQKFLSRLFRQSGKRVFKDALEKFIKDNPNIKSIIDNPNTDKQRWFRNAYNNWVNDPNNKDLQYDLIDRYLDLDTATILSKTEILDKVLNIGYNRLSNILGKIMENPQNIDNSISTFNITNPREINIIKEYYNRYKEFGSGKRQNLKVDAINKYKQLADDSDYWFETFNFYKQTINSLIDGWKYGKQGLEVKMLDKYRAYLNNIEGVKDENKIEELTLVYKKSIDNTYRSYLMIQDDLATGYLNNLTNTLKQKSTNPKALEFSKIIEELKSGSLGEKYPGFRLTYYLANVKGGGNMGKVIWKSINPGKNNLQNIMTLQSKRIPKWIINGLNSNIGKTMRRTLLWGAFPNKELLYTLIANSRVGIQKKQKMVLYKLYLQYSFLGALRSSIQTIFIPVAYTFYTLMHLNLRGYLEQNNIQFLPKLTDEEKKQIDPENSFIDIVRIFSKEFSTHYYKTWASVGQIENGGLDSKIYQVAYGIGVPNEVKSFNNSIIANVITKMASFDIGGFPNKDYDSFYNMVFSNIIPTLNGFLKGILDAAKNEGDKVQAGGSDITINNPTWSYGLTIGTKIQIVINFDYNNTKQIKVNNKYTLTKDKIGNFNNKPTLIAPKNLSISSIELTDNSNKIHNIKKQ